MENKFYPNLAKSIQIGDVTFKNRILGAPMSNPEMDTESHMRREDVAFHANRVKGGLSSTCIGLGVVSPEGRTHTKEVTLYDVMSLPSLKEFSNAVHRHGALAVMELTHGGKYANARGHAGVSGSSMGPNDEVGSHGNMIHAMNDEEILAVAEEFGEAAKLVKEAGIDMILLHAGHGWLLHQFISPAMNKRTDKWGGSLENRMRFTLLVIEKIREAVGQGYPIEFRYSGAEFDDGGYTIEEGVEIAKAVDGKVDLIHVSAGVHENPEVFGITHPSMFVPEGCNVFLAAEVKKHVKTPVATLGGLSDMDMMEDIIASGKADIVEVARQSICDPYFVEKAFSGKSDEIVSCCRCFTCFYNYLTNRTYACAFNPEVGNELACQSAPVAVESAKKVIVIGGGPGGMEAACTAAQRGHTVSLYEKSSSLGGQLRFEEHIPFKKNMHKFVKVMEKRLEDTGVEVHLNHALCGKEVANMDADAVIVAVGASPIVPSIEGIDSSKVVGLDVLTKANPELGENVVILGGGLVGTEVAIYLDGLGKNVTMIEMNDDWATDSYFMHKNAMATYIRKSNIKIHTSSKAIAINDEGLVCDTPDGQVVFSADHILLAAGMRPNIALAKEFENTAPRVFEIGDAIRTARVSDAVSDGYYRALAI
ncbi:oxidoreductase [Tannockella kyphosi]|uniref:oxidoreductase n=1 Tax=Tannockella kyphosi TaxID=2899121 RepID=UPI002011B6A3|nr:FAD-dependent oxidoreductase [Tannockella kyphosi]